MRWRVYILYIMMSSSSETVLCLCRRTVMSRLKNMEMLRSSSCVRGGNCLWCSVATILRVSACVVDDLGDVQWSLFRVSATGYVTRLNWVLLTIGSKRRVVLHGDFVVLCMGWRQSMMKRCNWQCFVTKSFPCVRKWKSCKTQSPRSTTSHADVRTNSCSASS